MDSRNRHRGCLLGLAVGDALGTTLEFRTPGNFEPITDMVGGGPFHLHPGQWTDDTSMALCLAESLIECQGFNPTDQLQRYVRWWRHGHWSSTGQCFDVGNTTRSALSRFERTGQEYCGLADPEFAGNGSLMRLAPIPMYYAPQPELAIAKAADSSRTTHAARTAVDACRYYAALIAGALHGAPKRELLSAGFCPLPGYWRQNSLDDEVAQIAEGSFKWRNPPEIRGTGYVVRCLEAALWAFHHSDDFRQGCLLAVSLGDDADTTGAVYGQLAGAFYGIEAIPQEWLGRLCMRQQITLLADQLFESVQSGSTDE